MSESTAQKLLSKDFLDSNEEGQSFQAIVNVTKSLHISKIIPNPDNRSINMDKVKEYMESIATVGLIHDPVVKPMNDGTFMLLSGEHRYLACCELAKQDASYEYIKCKIMHQDNLKSELVLIDANLESNELTPCELVKAIGRKEEIHKLLATPGTLRNVIAEECGLKPTQAGKYLKIYKKATPEIMQALEENSITLEKASQLVQMSPEEQELILNGEQKIKSNKREVITKTLTSVFKGMEKISKLYYQDDELASDKKISNLIYVNDQVKRQYRRLLYELAETEDLNE